MVGLPLLKLYRNKFFKFYFFDVTVYFMFFYNEPNVIEKHLRESGGSNFVAHSSVKSMTQLSTPNIVKFNVYFCS